MQKSLSFNVLKIWDPQRYNDASKIPSCDFVALRLLPRKFEDPQWNNEDIAVQTVLEMENHNFKYTLLYEIYKKNYGLICTMLNKTLAEKNMHICIFPKSYQQKM